MSGGMPITGEERDRAAETLLRRATDRALRDRDAAEQKRTMEYVDAMLAARFVSAWLGAVLVRRGPKRYQPVLTAGVGVLFLATAVKAWRDAR